MKIVSSNVAIAGYSESKKTTKVKTSGATLVSNKKLNLTENNLNDKLSNAQATSISTYDSVFVSEQSRKLSSSNINGFLKPEDTSSETGNREAGSNDQTQDRIVNQSGNLGIRSISKAEPVRIKSLQELRLEMLERLLRMFAGNGKQFKISNLFDKFKLNPNTSSDPMTSLNNLAQNVQQITPANQQTVQNQAQMGYVTTVQHQSVELFETESMSFNSQISVKTADGRSINVNLELNVSRELYSKFESAFVSETYQKLCDPLVINFGASSAGLTDIKFSFDLDCDGQSDQISQLAAGSGFLALDLNNDGKINDGRELFGAISGNGFADLARYDGDGNGWIDESDPIFDKLRIWTKDESGKDHLIALGELGIGAIYLGYATTDYTLQSASNDINGIIRKTGVFLNEDGTAGTIQHVDFAI